jgi:hypothetical protein
MWITVASNRSRKFRSLTGRIAELDKQLGSVNRTIQNVTDGLGEDAVSESSILSASVGSDAIQTQSITADKIAPSVFETASSGVQRVPAPLTSSDYWELAISGNITAFSDAYFLDKENKNVSASENGITFSPEANTQVIVSTAELKLDGLVVIKTRTAHGWEVGDYITVSNLGSPLDGEWVISDVPTTTSFCYTLEQYEESNVSVDLLAYATVGGDRDAGNGYSQRIIQKSFVDGVVTLVLVDDTDASPTSNSHEYQVGYVVSIDGLGSPYDGEHQITAIPTGQSTSIQYRLDTKTIAEFTPRVLLESAWGNGDFITYEAANSSSTYPDNLLGVSPNQFVEISGFSVTTGYNGVKQVSGVYGAGKSFTVDSTVVPATDAAETGSTYYCYNAEVKAEADAVMFLTGKNPVPASRNVVIGWVSDNPISFNIVVWEASNPGLPLFIPVNSDTVDSIYSISGLNKYLWEVPDGISHYAIYAEVLSGGTDTLLKECYVFESVGDVSKKVEKITNAFVDALAGNANEVTLYTATTHPYEVDDSVTLLNMDKVSGTLNKEFTVSSVATDKRSFTVSVPVQTVVVSTTSGSNSVYTTSTYNGITGTTSNLDVSGLIYVGQPYTSSNTTALPNGTVTKINSSDVLTDIKTGLVATLTSGANTITLTTGNTTNMFIGQKLTKTSGTGAFGNSGVAYVTAITNSTALTVDVNHATSGSTTFKSSEVSKLYDNFTVANNSGATNSSVTLTFYLPTTDASSNVSVTASSIGGKVKHQTSTVNPAGLSITSLNGQAVNLTDDATDNYVSVYNADSVAVASISNVGTGTFIDVNVASNLSAATATFTSVVSDSASLTESSDFMLANSNTYLVGNFANAVYNNNTAYTGSYLDRLGRGTIYQATWDIPTTNVPSGVKYYGLAAGSFQVESDRVYQVFVSMSGLRFSPDKNVSAEILMSDSPIRVTDPETNLARMATALRPYDANTYAITSQYFQHLVGFFQSVPATGSNFVGGVTTNLTSATITSWSRASSSNTITVNLANSNPLSSYIKVGDYISTTGMGNTSYHGTWTVASIVNTTAFTYNAYNVASAFTNTGSTGTVTLVEPQMVNASPSFTMSASATATPTTITYPMRNYFIPGQRVNITGSLSPNTFLVSNVVVTAANATSFTVSSSNVGSTSTSTSSAATASWTADELQKHRSYLPAGKPIYWILRLRFQSNTAASVGFTVTGYPNGMLAVTDVGQAKSITYTTQAQDWTEGFPPGLPSGFGNTNTTTTVTTYTANLTYTATDSAYYDNYGKGNYGTTDPYTNQESLYQGNAGTASGTKKSAILFPAISFPGAHANNRTITKVEVYLRNRHSYSASGLTTKLGMSTSTSLGSSIPTNGVSSVAPTSTTFTKGQGKWVTLGSQFHSYANASTLRTIVMSLIDESPITYDSTQANYGYFDGANQSDPPKLRITYTYTVTTTS